MALPRGFLLPRRPGKAPGDGGRGEEGAADAGAGDPGGGAAGAGTASGVSIYVIRR